MRERFFIKKQKLCLKQPLNMKPVNNPLMAKSVAELVFIPATAIGHIMSIIEMAKLLIHHDQNLSINILLINPIFQDFALTAFIESLTRNPINRIRFTRLPQPPSHPKINPKSFMTSLYEYINSHRNYVREIVMNQESSRSVIVGFVVDVFCTGMIEIGDEFNVPSYVFYTCSSAFLGFNLYVEKLCVDRSKEHVIQVSNSDGEMAVPSFVNPLPTKVFPALYQVQDGIDFLVCSGGKMKGAKGIMVNTFLELETHAIESFSGTGFPPVYPVGPLLNLHGVVGKDNDTDVISWLDGQPADSVVLLCFGSMGSFSEVQVKEIARGLEQSGYRFVWVLRRPPLLEQSSDNDDVLRSLLPDGFLERTMGRGKVIGWASQVSLLAHKAIGGFVSHCGWNSMLESLWFGVPTATWPLYAEQQMNAFEMVVELGLAVDLKLDYKVNMFNPDDNTNIVTAGEIERGIKRVMEDSEVRAKMKEMGQLSRATMAQGGSSYASVGHLIQEILSNIM